MVPRYIINFDEFIGIWGKELTHMIVQKLKDKYPQVTLDNIEDLFNDIKHLLPNEKYKKIKGSIDLIINKNSFYGIQKAEGRLIDVPPIIKETEEVFKFDKDVYLTGLHFNQTGWKKTDKYSLRVDKLFAFEDIFTKEVGEHKYFNTYPLVTANTPIIFTLDNKSGNSRQTILDLEYIEKMETPTPPKPSGQFDIDDIDKPWDVAVRLDWESGSPADIDLHGFLEGALNGEKVEIHTWYNNFREDTDFRLDVDCKSHVDSNQPEIISVNGYSNCTLNIYIHNYNPTKLMKPVNIKIYRKNSLGIQELKNYDIKLPTNKVDIIGVCSINLKLVKSLGEIAISDLNNNMNFEESKKINN